MTREVEEQSKPEGWDERYKALNLSGWKVALWTGEIALTGVAIFLGARWLVQKRKEREIEEKPKGLQRVWKGIINFRQK